MMIIVKISLEVKKWTAHEDVVFMNLSRSAFFYLGRWKYWTSFCSNQHFLDDEEQVWTRVVITSWSRPCLDFYHAPSWLLACQSAWFQGRSCLFRDPRWFPNSPKPLTARPTKLRGTGNQSLLSFPSCVLPTVPSAWCDDRELLLSSLPTRGQVTVRCGFELLANRTVFNWYVFVVVIGRRRCAALTSARKWEWEAGSVWLPCVTSRRPFSLSVVPAIKLCSCPVLVYAGRLSYNIWLFAFFLSLLCISRCMSTVQTW